MLKNLEVRLSLDKETKKSGITVYDPNVQHVVAEAEKNFLTKQQAEVWMEAWTSKASAVELEMNTIFRAELSSEDLEKFLLDVEVDLTH